MGIMGDVLEFDDGNIRGWYEGGRGAAKLRVLCNEVLSPESTLVAETTMLKVPSLE